MLYTFYLEYFADIVIYNCLSGLFRFGQIMGSSVDASRLKLSNFVYVSVLCDGVGCHVSCKSLYVAAL